MVTNDYPQITLDLSTEWVAHHRAGAPDLYPVAQRPEIGALMLEVDTDLNNGVHRVGFASSQEAYQTGYDGCSGAWTHSPSLYGHARRPRRPGPNMVCVVPSS